MTKVSDYIAEYFLQNGIDTCFTVTGGGAMHLNDSFGHHPKYKNIYNHHEQASAIAAEGYARTCGKPAIVSVTSGPGATNAITGVYGAWADSVPMIVLSGQMKRETLLSSTPVELRYLGFQESNIIEMVRPITKYSAQLNDVRYLKYHLDCALSSAISGRKGPVWLDIPIDIQGLQTTEVEFLGNLSLQDRKSINFTSGTDLKLDQILHQLERSKKPVLMLGEEIWWSGNYSIVKKLYESLQIPVVTEWNAHDLIESSHPLNCGRPGTIGNRGGNFVVQDADLVIALGCQLSIRQISYVWQNFAKAAKLVCINSDPNELDKPTLKVDIPVIADCGDFAKALIPELDRKGFEFSQWLSWSKYLNSKYPVVKPSYFDQAKPINAYAVIDKITNQMNENSTLILANGAACVVGLQASVVKEKTRIFTNSGASGMGYGIAAAIGAAVAKNGSADPVICIEGDGSIMMNLQELQTISTNNLNIKMLILNNAGYHSIKQTQNNIFDAKSRGYCGANADSGLEFPDFGALANAFGIEYLSVLQLTDLDEKISKFLDAPGAIIGEIFVDPEQDFEPKLISKLLDDGSFHTPSLEDMYPFLSEDELIQNKFKN